jgi:hypothetical protein
MLCLSIFHQPWLKYSLVGHQNSNLDYLPIWISDQIKSPLYWFSFQSASVLPEARLKKLFGVRVEQMGTIPIFDSLILET